MEADKFMEEPEHKHRPEVRQNPCCYYLVCGDCGKNLHLTNLKDLGIHTDDWGEMPGLGDPSPVTTGTPGVMHPVDRAFYDLTVQQRNRAWTKVGELREKVRELEQKLAQKEETYKEHE